MKTLGIIGGIGPESTIDYYHSLMATYSARVPCTGNPRLLINSIDNRKVIALVTGDKREQLADYLLAEIGRLERAGAEFGLLAANTPNIVFDELARESPIPLISIVEATAAEARRHGWKRLGLFGTRFTMAGAFYNAVFARAGLSLVVPGAADQAYLHDKYMNELFVGTFLPETGAGLLTIIDHLKAREEIDAVILGGTELPLILRDADHNGLPLITRRESTSKQQ